MEASSAHQTRHPSLLYTLHARKCSENGMCARSLVNYMLSWPSLGFLGRKCRNQNRHKGTSIGYEMGVSSPKEPFPDRGAHSGPKVGPTRALSNIKEGPFPAAGPSCLWLVFAAKPQTRCLVQPWGTIRQSLKQGTTENGRSASRSWRILLRSCFDPGR